jgi:orotate phosphoribosyltransferase
MISAAGGAPHAVTIALDRQEMAAENGVDKPWSAVQYVQRELGLQAIAIATLADLLTYLKSNADPALGAHHARVMSYRERYGV